MSKRRLKTFKIGADVHREAKIEAAKQDATTLAEFIETAINHWLSFLRTDGAATLMISTEDNVLILAEKS